MRSYVNRRRAVGTRPSDRDRVRGLVATGVGAIIIDSSQGDSMFQHEMVRCVRFYRNYRLSQGMYRCVMIVLGKVGVTGCLKGRTRFRVDNGSFGLCFYSATEEFRVV
jgi:hypothetical protein